VNTKLCSMYSIPERQCRAAGAIGCYQSPLAVYFPQIRGRETTIHILNHIDQPRLGYIPSATIRYWIDIDPTVARSDA